MDSRKPPGETVWVLDVASEFDLPTDRVWLNASHQGPMPRRSLEALERVVGWKMQPHHLQSPDPFRGLIDDLRRRLAALVGADPADIVIANSASYGLHLIANGLELEAGDEVLVAANDFPSDVLPWLRLERHGVVVRELEPAGAVLTADEVAAAVTRRTRVVCLTWVHSFSGQMIDLDAIGTICRDADTLFVVNGSQAVGAIPLDVARAPIDAMISVGFKWLCGPYGTGFCWLGERARERVVPTKFYWLNALSTDDLQNPRLDLRSIEVPDVGRYDIFGTANFFNNAPFAESVSFVDETGIAQIRMHNLDLADRLVDGVDPGVFQVQDRGSAQRRSSIVFVKPLGATADQTARRLAEAGIDVALRSGMLRFSPHFYNTLTDIDRAIEAVNS